MHISGSMDLSKNPAYPMPLFSGSTKAREKLFLKNIEKDAAVKLSNSRACNLQRITTELIKGDP